jgi:tripartite-type tricarboxylate transporter receptor subunit TctC
MKITIRNAGLCLAPFAIAYSSISLAQDKPPGWPERPIRIVISVAPGAGADMVARMTAQIMSEKLGQNVIVESRPGGGGVIATTYASKAEPDGYTLYQNGFGLLLLGATKRVPFNVLTTFEPVVRTTSQPYILLANTSLPVNSVKELVKYASTKTVTYSGSSGIGSTVHIGMQRLASLSNMKLKYVAYKGSAPSILALMGGEINMAATSAMSAIAAIKTGKVRGLATLGLKRVPVLPDLPSVAEQGFPGFSITNSYNLWAPAGTSPKIITALNAIVAKGMNAPAIEKRLAASGSEAVDPMSPKQLKAELTRDYAELEKSVKELGLKF